MNLLDVIILVVMVIAVFMGLRVGLIKAVLSLAGVIIGIVLAGRLYVPLSGQLSFIPQPEIAEIVAFAIILLGVMIVAGVAARLLKWAASAMLLGWVNSLGGAVFGFVLGVILCGALLATWVKFLGVSEIISQSSLAVILLDRFPVVLALLPDDFDTIRSFFQ